MMTPLPIDASTPAPFGTPSPTIVAAHPQPTKHAGPARCSALARNTPSSRGATPRPGATSGVPAAQVAASKAKPAQPRAKKGFALTFIAMAPDEELVGIARMFAMLTGRPSSARVERLVNPSTEANNRYRAHVRDGAQEACVEHEDARVALGAAFSRLEAEFA